MNQVEFWRTLRELLLGASAAQTMAFVVTCAVFGCVVVVVDLVHFSLRRTSFLGLTYGDGRLTSIRLLLIWGVGAGFGGYLGTAAGVVQLTRQAALGVGVGWPLIVPRLINSLKKDEDRQPPARKRVKAQ